MKVGNLCNAAITKYVFHMFDTSCENEITRFKFKLRKIDFSMRTPSLEISKVVLYFLFK